MSNTAANNKRIAKNTLLLYVRTILVMLVSLYTSRVILDVLGVEDYGIYNVVGGVVAMFSILSGSISVAISRYLTYELGTGNRQKLNTIFCTSINIQILMGVVIFIIAETAGVWFLNNQMNIPAERMEAANWVFQCSIVTFIINLISVPYNALIIANERMSAFAYIGLIEAILKLTTCYLLYISPIDKLILWAVMLTLVSVCMRIIYGVYAKRHFEESRYHWVIDKALMKDMSKFIGWAFLGNGVVILRDHGTNILLNIFFGPAVNAARGIAMSVNTAMYSFVTNFMTAINPQITKSYAQSDFEGMNILIIRGCRFGFFILMLLVIPVCVNIDYILNLWLIDVPNHTAAFIVLTLMYSMVECYVTPLCTGVLANGYIKRYELQLTIIYVVNFIVIYLILKWGASPEWVFALAVLFKTFVAMALLCNGRTLYKLKISYFIRKAVIKPMLIFTSCFLISWWIKFDFANEFLRFILSAAFSFVLSAISIWWIGLEAQERKGIVKIAINRIQKIKNKYE